MTDWLPFFPLALTVGLRLACQGLARRGHDVAELISILNRGLVAVGLASVCVTWVAGLYRVTSGSMAPTLAPGDIFVVDHLSCPQRGEIILVRPPPQLGQGRAVVKRLLATENDRVAVLNGRVRLNGTWLKENYADFSRGAGPDYPEQVVPRGAQFLLGDCRGNSIDSRTYGPVPRASTLGRASVLVWPPGRARSLQVPPAP